MVQHLFGYEFRMTPRTDTSAWPYTIPAVRQLVEDGGVELAPGVTFLVGSNGSGKSTIVEAMAAAYPRHGHDASHVGLPTAGAGVMEEDSPLRHNLAPRLARSASPAGFFLRSETLRSHLASWDAAPRPRRADMAVPLMHRSHGEAVLELLRQHFDESGVYFLDEPENGLAFTALLALVQVLAELAAVGSQVVVATHSPVVAALPGATILELDDDGFGPCSWEDLALVADWRAYLDAPTRYLRHLVDPGPAHDLP